MATTSVEVVSPSQVVATAEVEMVVCRTVGGEVAFLANHLPFLGALEPCVVRLVDEDGSELALAVSGGFVEVRDNHVIVLADDAERGEDVDVEAARAEREAAAARLRDDADDAAAGAALAVATARLEAAGVRSD